MISNLKKICLTTIGVFLGASNLYAAIAIGASDHNAQLMHAKFGTNQVKHKMFYKNSKKVPHTFYKDYCKNKIPHSYANASGNGSFLFDKKENTLYYAFSYYGLSGSPIMMHFHLGKAGKGGPILQTICGHPPPGSKSLGHSPNKQLSSLVCPTGSAGFITGHYHLQGNSKLKTSLSAEQEMNDLIHGNVYINIHTCLNEAGEIRGQIVNSASSHHFL